MFFKKISDFYEFERFQRQAESAPPSSKMGHLARNKSRISRETGPQIALFRAKRPALVRKETVFVVRNIAEQGRTIKAPGLLEETEFYTPPVLGGAALHDNSAPAAYINFRSLGHRNSIRRCR